MTAALQTPTALSVPKSDASGKLDNGWFNLTTLFLDVVDTAFSVVDAADPTKRFQVDVNPASATGVTLTLDTGAQPANVTLSVPPLAANDVVAVLATAQVFSGAKTFTATMTITDVNVVLSTTTGTKWGTATNQKQGWWGATPVVQPASADQAALVDNIAGALSATLAAIPDPADSPVTADALRDDLVANTIPKIRDALSSMVVLLNALRSAQVTTGLIKGSA